MSESCAPHVRNSLSKHPVRLASATGALEETENTTHLPIQVSDTNLSALCGYRVWLGMESRVICSQSICVLSIKPDWPPDTISDNFWYLVFSLLFQLCLCTNCSCGVQKIILAISILVRQKESFDFANLREKSWRFQEKGKDHTPPLKCVHVFDSGSTTKSLDHRPRKTESQWNSASFYGPIALVHQRYIDCCAIHRQNPGAGSSLFNCDNWGCHYHGLFKDSQNSVTPASCSWPHFFLLRDNWPS